MKSDRIEHRSCRAGFWLRCLMPPWCPALLALGMIVCATGWAGAAKPEADVWQNDLNDDDIDALQVLFVKMGGTFLAGDAKATKTLLSESDERDTITDTLKREFKEAKYLDFQVERPLPDNRTGINRYSVDVTIRLKMIYLDDSRRPEDRKPIENTTFQNFIVQREINGSFRIVNSSFFDNMGRRSGGIRWIVEGMWAVMLVCIALAFWVWMGAEALWMRPKSRVWRFIALIPLIGSLIFFFACYLTGRSKRKATDRSYWG